MSSDYIDPSPATWPLPRRETLSALARAAMLQARQDAEQAAAEAEAQHIEAAERRRAESVEQARETARRVLGPEAASQLAWTAGAGDEWELDATAELPGVPHAVLRFTQIPGQTGTAALDLVWGCPECGGGRSDAVTDLAQLGELLAAGLPGGAR